jgi:two-component system, NtrC family, C4-dicarboxylate transport response regulator DctD
MAGDVKPRVLFVDGDESVRLAACALLEHQFDVSGASSAEEALAWMRHNRIDVLCADFQMPGISGIELLEQVAELYPNVGGILVTGHRDFLRGGRVDDRLAYSVLLKPYAAEELLERVQRAVQTTEIRRSLSGAVRPELRQGVVAGRAAATVKKHS